MNKVNIVLWITIATVWTSFVVYAAIHFLMKYW
jgi:hypothetical protein